MTKSKFKVSLIVLLSLAILMLSFGVITLVNTQNAYADTTEIACENGSGASINPYVTVEDASYEGIRFTFKIAKNKIAEGASAQMLVLPTELIGEDGLIEGADKVFAEDYGTVWTEVDGNYEFVATLYAIPANRYDIEVSARMCFTDGESVEYSQVLASSIRQVARAGYDSDTLEDSEKQAIEKYLLNNGEKFTVTYSGTSVVEEYLWGDTITADSTELEGKTFTNDKGETLTLEQIKALKVTSDITFNIVSESVQPEELEQLDGEIMYSTKDNSAVIPSTYGTVTKIVYKLDESVVYYENGVYTNVPQYTSTATGVEIKTAKENGTLDTILPTYQVIVYNGDTAIGVSTMKSYTKVMTDRDDFNEEFGKVDEGTETKMFNTRVGYYIVANDVNYTTEYSKRVVTTFVNGGYINNLFKGYFDGNGKTINAYIEGGGLFGDLESAVVADMMLNVIAMYNVNSNRADYSGVAIAQTANNSILENVYIYYDKAVTESFVYGTTPTERHLVEGAYTGTYEKSMYGIFSAKSLGNTYNNVILDVSNLVVSEYSGSGNYYAAPIMGGNASVDVVINGLYILQSRKIIDCVYNNYGTRVVFAENDATGENNAFEAFKAENSTLTDKQLYSRENLYRYDNLEALAGAVSTVGNFTVTTSGITWTGATAE